MAKKKKNIWKVKCLDAPYKWEGELKAYWEVELSAMSGDYYRHEVTAEEMFWIYVKHVKGRYPDDLIPIYWSVQCIEEGKQETMPFQYNYSKYQDFLKYYTHPVNKETGEKLNWLSLPVVDQSWDKKYNHANASGFIQQVTGWKPSILQPFVWLNSLLQMR